MITFTVEEKLEIPTKFKTVDDLLSSINKAQNKMKIRDDAWFTKEKGEDLKKIREDSKKWKNISKPYGDVKSLISDLKKDEVSYN